MATKGILQRGTRVLDHRQTQDVIKQERHLMGPQSSCDPHAFLSVAGAPLMLEDETQHFKIVGLTGTGKTSAICELIGGALARGDRAIIADPDGAYARRFYNADRHDVVLNPFLKASPRWDIFSEISEDYDIEDIARSLIADMPNSNDQEWREYARTFFISTAQKIWRQDKGEAGLSSTQELHWTLTQPPVEDLRLFLANTPAASFVDENGDRMFNSIRSVLSSAVRGLEYVGRQQGPPFSVREWVRGDKEDYGQVLFLPYNSRETEALKSTISAWMRLGIYEAMSGGEEGDQRLWFVVDELSKLGPIGGLPEGLTQLRKYGGRMVLGFQSIDQVEGLYGRNNANAIVENCGNTLLLRCGTANNGGTSEFASKLIGDREMMRITKSRTSRGLSDGFGSTTKSPNFYSERATMAAELEQLPKYEGFLRVGSRTDWLRVKVSPGPSPRRPPLCPFLERVSTRPVDDNADKNEGHETKHLAGKQDLMKTLSTSPKPEASVPPNQRADEDARTDDEVNSIEPQTQRADKTSQGKEEAGNGRNPIDPFFVPEHIFNKFYKKNGDNSRFYFKDQEMEAFLDEGSKLSTKYADESVLDAFIEIATGRKWKSIKVQGSSKFKREMWIRACQYGISVTNYEPTPEDHAELARRPNQTLEKSDESPEDRRPEPAKDPAKSERAQPSADVTTVGSKQKPTPVNDQSGEHEESMPPAVPKTSAQPVHGEQAQNLLESRIDSKAPQNIDDRTSPQTTDPDLNATAAMSSDSGNSGEKPVCQDEKDACSHINAPATAEPVLDQVQSPQFQQSTESVTDSEEAKNTPVPGPLSQEKNETRRDELTVAVVNASGGEEKARDNEPGAFPKSLQTAGEGKGIEASVDTSPAQSISAAPPPAQKQEHDISIDSLAPTGGVIKAWLEKGIKKLGTTLVFRRNVESTKLAGSGADSKALRGPSELVRPQKRPLDAWVAPSNAHKPAADAPGWASQPRKNYRHFSIKDKAECCLDVKSLDPKERKKYLAYQNIPEEKWRRWSKDIKVQERMEEIKRARVQEKKKARQDQSLPSKMLGLFKKSQHDMGL